MKPADPGERAEEWEPAVPIPIAPMFEWPPKPIGVLRFFAWKQFWPGGAMWLAAAWLCWRYATPDARLDGKLRTLVGLRSSGCAMPPSSRVLAGGLHWWLYRQARAGDIHQVQRAMAGGERPVHLRQRRRARQRSSGRSSAESRCRQRSRRSAGGCSPTATAPTATSPGTGPTSWSCSRRSRFYWGNAPLLRLTHRLLHVGKLYDFAHSQCTTATPTPGPWSGISMHPIEHLLYMSPPVLLWFIPGHPVVHLTLLFFSLLSPILTHAGFERVWLGGVDRDGDNGGASFLSGDYFHQLHHRYFECNYGNTLVPLDKVFGTYHDGTPEAHAAMRERQRNAGRS